MPSWIFFLWTLWTQVTEHLSKKSSHGTFIPFLYDHGSTRNMYSSRIVGSTGVLTVMFFFKMRSKSLYQKFTSHEDLDKASSFVLLQETFLLHLCNTPCLAFYEVCKPRELLIRTQFCVYTTVQSPWFLFSENSYCQKLWDTPQISR